MTTQSLGLSVPAVCSEEDGGSASSARALEAWLVEEVAARVGTERAAIKVTDRFHELGVGSQMATALVAALGEKLGRTLSPTIIWEHPSIEALARMLVSGESHDGAAEAEPRVGRGASEGPIAVVGIACRFPGGASSAEAFWELLRGGGCAITRVPASRWNPDALADADVAQRTGRGAFLDRIDEFDPAFFGISPREAADMDPQQRLVLELAWQALEDARIVPATLAGTDVGVFVGAILNDYKRLRDRLGAVAPSAYTSTGNHHSLIANRISYALGLTGPSLVVDTACSSSLTALHLAVQSLSRGESTCALVGGVQLNLEPQSSIELAKLGALSPDGTCYTFDARANGFVRGEGSAIVVLKRLADAVRDGDRIYAVVRGSAVNNDGASNGLTAPSPEAQVRVLREACRQANVSPASVHYVELHGTGTVLGDPIEAGALGAVYGKGRAAEEPLLVGSVKTNIGHLEGAAGIAGIVKTVLALFHRRLPPALNYETPNPHIDFDALNLRVVTGLRPWPGNESETLRAGVSSFGFGGTNAHIVLESWEAPPEAPVVFSVAADTEAALERRLRDLRAEPPIVPRSPVLEHGRHRVVVCAQPNEVLAALESAAHVLAGGASDDRVFAGRSDAPVRPVFVYPGLGPQWFGMGRRLYAEHAAFRDAFRECDEALRAYSGQSVMDELWADAASDHCLEDFDATHRLFPVLIATQIAITATWRSLGVEPGAVVGQSMGEVAAAEAAGILDIPSAMRVIAELGKACRAATVSGRGILALVAAGPSEVAPLLEASGGRAFLGGHLSPESCVLAGEVEAVREILSALGARGVRSRVLTNHFVHTPLMVPFTAPMHEALSKPGVIAPNRTRPRVTMMSTADSAIVAADAELDATYWTSMLERTVWLSGAARDLACAGHECFVEISPHAILPTFLEATLAAAGTKATTLPSQLRTEDGEVTIRRTLARLHALGAVRASGEAEAEAETRRRAVIVPLSARTEGALREQASRLLSHLEAHGDVALEDVAYSLATTRTAFEERAAVVAADTGKLKEGLAALAAGEAAAHVTMGRATAAGKAVFVFPGQGSQWAAMGRSLLETSSVFREEITSCARALSRHVDWSLLDVLRGEEGAASLERVDVVQPALFAVMVSLAAVWRSLGVEPDAVVGHSQGEIAAAYVAGALTLEDAAKIVALRSRALARVAGSGTMASVELSSEQLSSRLAKWGEALSIAAVNGPSSCLVSGEASAVDALVAELTADGVFARRVKVDYASHCAAMDVLRDELHAELADVRPRATRVAFHSTVMKAVVAGETLDAAYWFQNLREPVAFAETVGQLLAQGHRFFVEVSSHPVLTFALRSLGADAVAVGTLRRGEGSMERVLLSAGELYARGYPVAWSKALPKGQIVALPTYAFQRERYWIDEDAHGGKADVAAAGLVAAEHPLLAAVLPLADGQGLVFTGRLSVATHPWLAGHVVFDRIILPGTAFLELALVVAKHVGLACVEELTLQAPLVIPAKGAVNLQISVVPDSADQGKKQIDVHARAEDGDDDAERSPWTLCATGTLAAAPATAAAAADLFAWPPPDATPVDLEGLHERFAGIGLSYGPEFRGLERVWKSGSELSGEVCLPPETARSAQRFNVHPALLDAVLQTLALFDGKDEVALPFVWRGISVAEAGATSLRFRVSKVAEDDFAVDLADASGAPLARIERLRMRHASRSAFLAGLAVRPSDLWRVDWTPLSVESLPSVRWAMVGEPLGSAPSGVFADLESAKAACATLAARGEATPDALVVHFAPEASAFLPSSAHEAAHRGLELVRTWLADASFAATRLVVVTTRAVAAAPNEDVVDLAHAPIWGLVRSAQRENPDRHLVLVDIDDDPRSRAALPKALGAAERELAVRGGELRTPRLVQAPPAASATATAVATATAMATPLDPEGTVLVTGGTGLLGALVARHLVERHHVKHLVLASRSGLAAPGVDTLVRQLEEHGASVTVATCDLGSREAVAALLATIPVDRPLTAVVHAAGVLDDGILGALDASRIDRVFAPKVDAATHLHELTRSHPLRAFVLFSSFAGTLGTAGQANYAAANTFLDALAHHRRAHGLPACSLAWGLWSERSSLTQQLSSADVARFARLGVAPMSSEQGLALFDEALRREEPAFVPAVFDKRALRGRRDDVHPMLRALVPADTRRTTPEGALRASLADRLAALDVKDRERTLLDLVRKEIAAVLHMSTQSLDPNRALKELGLDSLTGVELRNRLNAATGLSLPSTLVFDHPTAAALVGRLRADLGVERERASRSEARPSAATAAAPHAPAVAAPASDSDDPIAIVAMSCRFPGGVRTPEQLWELLEQSTDAISPFPENRGWSVDDIFDPDPDAIGKTYVRHGGFLHDGDRFDAEFFGISPREALAVDPQQRLLLETSWEALERARIRPASLQGSATGVFVGVMYNDYGVRLAQSNGSDLEGHILVGSSASVASGRIAYTFGFEGPAVTVDTVCSSSLVALHLACQALRRGECSMALAGGATLMATPTAFIEFSRQRALSRDARCRSFSADANGAIWAEGVGMLLLERLSDAKKNGHPVLAIVRGSAVNQDGKSQGLTAPNGLAQERVIRLALESARLSPAEVDAVEAHGTGTVLGDPIEAQALLATYGSARDADRPVWIGSLKSNVGHTQAAAGVAGVIKMVLALGRGVLPKTLHADTPSPHVDWSRGSLRLLTDAQPWLPSGHPRRAGISSFGLSGTNTHVIIEDAPDAPSPAEVPSEVSFVPVPFVLSAKTARALQAQAEELRTYLAAHAEVGLHDVAYSLAETRTTFEHGAVVVARDTDDLVAALGTVADEGTTLGLVRAAEAGTGLAFLFTGQGSQRAGMGRALYDAFPAFRDALDACIAQLDRHLSRPLRDIVFAVEGWPEAELLHETVFTQPALFALEVALFRVLESWGVLPDVVMGHSIGEIAAAHVAGVMSLEDACTLVAARGRLMQALPKGGAMVAVSASEAEVRAAILEHSGGAGTAGIAAVNGPASVVLSGDEDAVLAVARSFEERGCKTSRLSVSHAFHSPHMDAMVEAFREVAAKLTYAEPRIRLVTNVTGAVATLEELRSPDFWVRHLRDAVRFADGIRAVAAEGVTTFVELGPHAVLSALAQDCLADHPSHAFISTLRKGSLDADSLVGALARVHLRGHGVDWPAFFAPFSPRAVALPTYAFQRERFWPDEPAPSPTLARVASGAEARFWNAVERGDIDTVATALDVRDGDRASLAALLPALTGLRDRQRADDVLSSWRYRVTWKPVPAPSPASPASLASSASLAGRWLLVTGDASADGALARAVGSMIAGRGGDVVVVTASSDDDDAVLPSRLTSAVSDGTVRGVVSLLALEQGEDAPGLPRALAATHTLMRALVAASITAPLWLFTQRAVAIGRSEPVACPLQGMVWGFGRVVALEHPERWGGLVDVEDTMDERALERLAPFLAVGEGEDQIAVRRSGVFVRRLLRATEPDATRAWKPRGTILVTGGTGALGAHVARWLAANGSSPHLVLASRKGPSASSAAAQQAELTALGATVTVASCDVADKEALANLLADLERAGTPVTSVFHTAGVAASKPLVATTKRELADVLAPKALGAQHLDELLADRPLDAFVLFSSIAGVWGSAEQCAYAAANAYLDGLAEQRRARGAAATSIAWGPWGGDGMAGADETQQYLAARGLLPLAPSRALAALGTAASAAEPTLTIADVDWGRFAPVFCSARPRPFVSTIPEATRAITAASDDHTAEERPALVAQLTATREQDRLAHALAWVLRETRTTLRYADGAHLDPDTGFSELGLDSIMALELRKRLRRASGVALPATATFDHPSPRRMAAFILGSLDLGDAASETSPAAVVLSAPADADDPVAIVGIGLRLPGGVVDLASLWGVLEGGVDAVGPIPEGRWDVDAFYDPDREAPGKSYVRHGAFLQGIDRFDASFFGINPREAKTIDPQHRLLLESAWRALEDARILPRSLADSRTGVFVGIGPSDYERIEGERDVYAVTGTHTSFAAGRLAYTLGLQGPALAVDTACSSSLVALHLACKALERRECELALAAGVQVMVAPGSFLSLSRTGALSPDGRCKTFSANADGYGRGEGVVVLVLERLSDARKKGRTVLGVVRGSAVNSDGASSSITAPNGTSQQSVLRAALADANLAPADVDVVECHGTGTPLGDPIELQALAAVYGQGRSPDAPLVVGTVKSNVGHLESASGLAGVAKVLASFAKRAIPKTLHAQPPNPHVDWSALPVQVAHDLVPWGERDERKPLRAGVSAFGMSGTNAHVILENVPAEAPAAIAAPSVAAVAAVAAVAPVAPALALPFVLSARSEDALRGQAEQLRAYLGTQGEGGLADVAYSLATTRTAFEHRAVVVAHDAGELARSLDAMARGASTATAVGSACATFGSACLVGHEATGVGKVAFLFTGQGSQRPGMGRALYDVFPVFRDALDASVAHFDGLLSRPLRDIVFAEDGSRESELLHETEFTQPALFALEVALFRVFESWGLLPDVVMGHSIGEIAAAHVAGVMSLEDACTLVAARSRLMQALPKGGAMVAVGASEAEVRAAILAHSGGAGTAGIAAVNGPTSVVLSGDEDAVLAVARSFEERGCRTSRLSVSHAFHSPRMDAMLDAFREVAAKLTYSEPRIGLVTNVTGAVATLEELRSPDFWVRHLRDAVRFADGIRAVAAEGVTTFVELGPHAVLSALAQDCLADHAELAFIPTLRKESPDADALALVNALALAHVRGHRVDWPAFFAPFSPRAVPLPTYAFQRDRHWIDETPRVATDLGSVGLASASHGLVGAVVRLADGQGAVLTGRVSLATHPWLAEHVGFDRVLFPAAAFLELALAAALELDLAVVELTLQAPLEIPPAGAVSLQVTVGAVAEDSARRTLRIYARPSDAPEDAPWTLHASGALGSGDASSSIPAFPSAWPPPDAVATGLDGLYERFADVGFAYGPAFRGLARAWKKGDELFAEVELAEATKAQGFALDPVLLTTALQVLSCSGPSEQPATVMPWAIEDVSLLAPPLAAAGARVTVRVHVSHDRETDAFAITLADAVGAPLAHVGALRMRAVSREDFVATLPSRSSELLSVEWTTVEEPHPAADARWGAVGDDVLGIAPPRTFRDLAAVHAALDRGEDIPDVLVVSFAPTAGDVPRAAHAATHRALAVVQAWLADERLEACRLVVVTQRAVATAADEDVCDLGSAPVWGLIRSTQTEHPGRRFLLVDVDDDPRSVRALASLFRSTEQELALRRGEARAPRLVHTKACSTPATATKWLGPEGTVLISGASGALGAIVARHVVEQHGARRVLLVARRALAGDDPLVRELERSGAHVTTASCDVADRAALAAVLAAIPVSHALTAVLHLAGVVDDGVVTSLDDTRIDRVLAPKVDGALNLHELTKDAPLDAFVLFSSLAGVLGTGGQASYAAANAFLDALAHHRRRSGAPATSLAWGLWSERSAITQHLSSADMARASRLGIIPLSRERGLSLFDEAVTRTEPALVTALFDKQALRARRDDLSPLFSRLVGKAPARARMGRGTSAAPFEERLALLDGEASRERAILDLVQNEIGAVLHADPRALKPNQALKEVGLTSLVAVELRNRLNRATGLRLPTTLAYNYPTAAAIARFIDTSLHRKPTTERRRDDAEWRDALASIPLSVLKEAGFLNPLMQLARSYGAGAGIGAGPVVEAKASTAAVEPSAIERMAADDLIRLALANTHMSDSPGAE